MGKEARIVNRSAMWADDDDLEMIEIEIAIDIALLYDTKELQRYELGDIYTY